MLQIVSLSSFLLCNVSYISEITYTSGKNYMMNASHIYLLGFLQWCITRTFAIICVSLPNQHLLSFLRFYTIPLLKFISINYMLSSF